MSASSFRALLLLVGLALASCGARQQQRRDPSPCTPGATQLCLCSASAHGAQVCDEDGRRWGPCRRCEHVEYGEEAWFDDMEDEDEDACDCGCDCGCVGGLIGTMGVGGLGVIGAGLEGGVEGEETPDDGPDDPEDAASEGDASEGVLAE